MAQEAPLENTPPRSKRMTLVGERQLPDPSPPISTSNPTPTTWTQTPPNLAETGVAFGELVSRAAWRQGVLGALNLAVTILAVRLIVLVAVAGGIALTWLALQEPDPMRLGTLAIYGVVRYIMHFEFVFLPATLAGTLIASLAMMLAFGYAGTAAALRAKAAPMLRNE